MPSDSSASETFSGNATFRAGAIDGLLITPDAPDDRYQFFDSLRMSILSSLQLADPSAQLGPAVFVRSIRPREAAAQFGDPTLVYDVDLQNPTQWEGRLVFAAQHGTGGWAVPMPGGQASQAVKALIDGGHGDFPFATVYPGTRIISCAVEGAAAGDKTLKLALPATSRTISLSDLAAVLELVRAEGLITPNVCPPGVWSDPAGYVPGVETERLLQWCVASEMRAQFRPILAEREQVTAVGRIDICLTDPATTDPSAQFPAVVELKALRSKFSSGNPVSERSNVAAVASGMRQAKAYRVKKKALLGILACFDLRQAKDDILAHATVQKAQTRYYDDQMGVTILPIYGSPDDAQDELATNVTVA